MLGFATAIKFNVQKGVVKDRADHAIQDMMKNIKKKRELVEQGVLKEGEELPADQEEEDDHNIEQKQTVFNKSMEEESRTINSIAQDLLRKVKYQKIFKSNDLDSASTYQNKSSNDNQDPRIKFFQKCESQMAVALPILDKIYKKTICLQDYTMSEGHCKGLATACEFFDAKVVNRVLMSNCGVNGDQFAMIL